MMRKVLPIVLGLWLLHGCGSGSSLPPVIFTGTVANQPYTQTFVDRVGYPIELNGIALVLSSKSDGTSNETAENDEDQIRFRIVDIAAFSDGVPKTIGISANNTVNFFVAGERFIATSGTLTLTPITRSVGATITAVFNLGFVNTSTITPHSATLAGSFSLPLETAP